MSQVHSDIAAVAQDKGAMVIHNDILRSIILRGIQRVGGKVPGVEVGTGNPAVMARYEGTSLDPLGLTLLPWVEAPSLQEEEGATPMPADFSSLSATIASSLSFTLTLFPSSDPSLYFCRVTYSVSELGVQMTGDGDALTFSYSFSDVEVDFSNADQAVRDSALAAAGLSENDLLRVEGLFAYGVGKQLLQAALGRPDSVRLSTLFPAVGFSGGLSVRSVNRYVVVVPEDMVLAGGLGCPIVSPTAGLEVDVSRPDATTGQFTVDARVPASRRPASSEDPLIALYAPKRLLDLRFASQTTPAIAHEDVGTGFIGHTLHITAAIKGLEVSVESGALRLSLRAAVWGSATLNVDLPCVGRVECGRLDIRLPDQGDAQVAVALRGAIDTSLRAVLMSELQGVNLGKAHVNFSLFGGVKADFKTKLISLKATIVSYIVDYVIGRIIANNLPWMVADFLKEALEDKYFVVANVQQLAGAFERRPNVATYSGRKESALLGCTYLG